MTLDISQIASQMLSTALPILIKGGGDEKNYTMAEFMKIAERIKYIGEQFVLQNLNQDEATNLLQAQVTETQIAIQAVEGLSMIVVENAINAALGVVNTALGFGLKI